jgi:hypothetical protein
MVLGCGVVMFGGMLMVLRSFAVVLSGFLGHGQFSPLRISRSS